MNSSVFLRLRQRMHALRGALATLVGAVLFAGSGCSRPATPPDQVERIGALELVTHFRTERGGDAARFAWRHVAHWSLRWQGQPLLIDTLGGLFGDQPSLVERLNAVFAIDRGQRVPDLLINVGDPNNTSAFHLVRQQGDSLEVRLLYVVRGGDNSVGWAQHVLDRGDDESLSTGLPGRPYWHHGPVRETLPAGLVSGAGGRYLMLGQRCLLDTLTDAVYWFPGDLDDAEAMRGGPAVVSPDGTRLARLGLLDRPGSGADRRVQPLLLVTELVTLPDGMVAGSVVAHRWLQERNAGVERQHIEIHRQRMRYPSLQEVDAAWVLHHFHWTRDAQGERLVERDGFEPLPYRGRFSESYAEYQVEGLGESRREYFVDFLIRRFGGEALPSGTGTWSAQVQVEGQIVNVTDRGFYIAGSSRPYFPGEAGDPKVQRDLVRRLGAAFDTELAGGGMDDWFAADSARH